MLGGLPPLKHAPRGKAGLPPLKTSPKQSPKPTNSSSGSGSQQRITPLRVLLQYRPPSLALVYRDNKYNKKRFKRFQVPIIDEDAGRVARQLSTEFPLYLSPTLVPTQQLVKLAQTLIDTQSFAGTHAKDSNEESLDLDLDVDGDSDKEEPHVPNTDLNKVPIEELEHHKQKMDKTYEKNIVSPDNPNYEYDKRKDFQPEEDNDWDDDDDDNDGLPPQSPPQQQQQQQQRQEEKGQLKEREPAPQIQHPVDEEEEEDIEEEIEEEIQTDSDIDSEDEIVF